MAKKFIVLLGCIFIVANSCSGLIEDLSNTNIMGSWYAVERINTKTNTTQLIDHNSLLEAVSGLKGNAISVNGDHQFDVFYQYIDEDGIDGSWTLDVLNLNLKYNSGKTKILSISSLSETNMEVRDTVSGVPFLVKFEKI